MSAVRAEGSGNIDDAAGSDERPIGAPDATRRRTAYVTPFRMPTNAYIEMQKELVRSGGFEMRPFSIHHLLLRGGLFGLLRRRNIVLVQWLESRPFHADGPAGRLSLRGSLLFVFYVTLLACTPARVVFFVHDHAVHDTSGRLRSLSRRLLQLLCRVADVRVVHDPSCTELYRAQYLPHPLFWDRPGLPPLSAQPSAASRVDDGNPARLHCVMLGAIRPYKSIDTILQVWPAGTPLLVAGRSTVELAASLQQIVDRRGLADCVTLDARHLSDADFDARLCDADVLILPHAAETALVSGAFFEALGRVPFIVARCSPFIDWACLEFGNVRAFSDPQELPALLESLQMLPLRGRGALAESALSAFGWQTCLRTWGAFLERITAPVSSRRWGWRGRRSTAKP